MIPKKIGITLGDPGGVGGEITLKALSSQKFVSGTNYILFGSRLLLDEEIKAFGLNLEIPTLNKKGICHNYFISLYEVETPIKHIKRGAPFKENGEASFCFFEEAVKQARKGTITSIVTAPISKHSWQLAGIKFAGHTEYLSLIYPQAIMSFWSDRLNIALFTHHIPLKKAIKRIRKDALLDFFLHLNSSIEKLCTGKHNFLVSGLNPHAGEEGLLGREELDEIIPAIEEAKKKGLPISGPFPPDTVCRNAFNHPDKIVIALYHDQGLIAFKLLSFNTGVNVTLGLPFIRTSPDHGAAFDIAGKGIANPQSMAEAIKFAVKSCK